MDEKELIARGAECVAGDLILGHTVVGKYRHGQFAVTPEGASELATTVVAQATEVVAPPRPKAAPRVKSPAKAAEPQDAPVHVAPQDLTNLDDLLDA